ncbi:APC family permease [Paraburkholderia bannensis]|uniref:APC family permease n=1 Tax=Paraburkholderia bannensis TaxID=765414 RepID=UPI002AC32DE7|nr:APC family permease [Paraburkholderia bannensis]
MSDLVIYGMVYMLPIAPFALYGMIDKASRGMVPFVYVLSLLAMAFTARSYQLLSREFPVAGSAYTYTLNGLGAFAGFLAGWMVLLDYIIIPGLLAVISGAAMNSLLPTIGRTVWIIGFVGMGTILNLVGVSVTARINKLLLCLMLLVLLIFFGVGGWALHEGKGHGELTMVAFLNPHSFTWAGLGAGVLLGSSNFLGFDAITTLGEEVRHEKRHLLGAAGIGTMAIIAILAIAQTWVAADLAPGAHILSADTAFYDIARYAGGNWLFVLVSVSTALAFGIPCAIVCQMGVSRIIYAMGRDRQLPRVMSRLSRRNRQPWVANLFVAAVTLLLALEFQNHLDEIALFQNFGALSAFGLVNLSVIGYFRFKKQSTKLFSHLILPCVALIIVAALMSAMRLETWKMGGTWIAAGFTYYWMSRRFLGRDPCIQA